MGKDRISEINRRLTILNLVIFFVLLVLITIEEYGQKFFIKISISEMGERHHRYRHKKLNIKKSELITTQILNDAKLEFPPDFLFGVASSAYQTEGALTDDGRSASTWDILIKENPSQIIDNSTAEIATNSYQMYKEDVKAINMLGFRNYKISISWNRIIPNGSKVNKAGIDHYHKVIDELLANGIEPIITMFHSDLPKYIQDLGGPPNPIFVDYFEAYADTLFENFGDKVKRWITFNEPFNYCVFSYGSGIWAPAIKSSGIGDYMCINNLLKAHATAYHLFQNKYFKVHGGEVGIVMDSPYFFPSVNVSTLDHERAMQYRLGFIANPIFGKDGGFPQVMIDEINNRSLSEGRPFSRLPEMDKETQNLIHGSSDFFGLNYYTSSMIKIDKNPKNLRIQPSWFVDSGVIEQKDPSWQESTAFWIYNVPQGLRELLRWIKKEYRNPRVLISENGWCDDGEIDDNNRIGYFIDHLNAVALAVNEDDCNVIGYITKSLLDSFEWNHGFTLKYGLFHVNRTSTKMERAPKASVKFWQDFLQTKHLRKSSKFF